MIWLVLTLWVIPVSLFVGLLRYVLREMNEMEAEHAKCIAHVASVTSNRFVAETLRDLADRWDSVEEIGELRRLANTVYQPGGPSMPVIWMHVQADRIEAGK